MMMARNEKVVFDAWRVVLLIYREKREKRERMVKDITVNLQKAMVMAKGITVNLQKS